LKHRFIIHPLIFQVSGWLKRPFQVGAFFDRIRDGIIERMNPQRAEEGSNSPG